MKRKVDVGLNTKRFMTYVKAYKLEIGILLLFIAVMQLTFVLGSYLFKLVVDASTEFLKGTLTRPDLIDGLIWLLLVFAFLFCIRIVAIFLRIHVLNRLESFVILDLKKRFFNHLVHLDHNFHTTHKTGSLISRLTRGGKSIEGMMDSFAFNFAPLFFQLVLSFIALLTIGWSVALLILVITMAFIGYSLWLQMVALPHNFDANRMEDDEKANISDIFTNIDSIKYFGREKDIKNRYHGFAERTRVGYLKMWDYFRWADAGQTLILSTGVVFTVVIPVMGILNGTMTLGDLTFVYMQFVMLIAPMFGFIFGMRNYYRALADLESLYEYDRFENSIKDGKGARNLEIAKGQIEFKDISFKYHEQNLFKKFSLTVKPGEKVALVGRSGAGKSTLVKLLYRLYDVKSGKILIDGKDVKEFRQESLRSELSIVPQECVLFDDTIWNNVKFSNPEASDDDIWKALKFAQLDTFVKNLPKKEQTVVGERGVKLSGGEKQRVSIARALLADKKILVLDEATASLDSETEHDIQADLQALMKDRTAIIIAHRLSTIMSADKIVVLEDGKILQMGTHEQLIKEKGQYKKLWDLQKGGYIG